MQPIDVTLLGRQGCHLCEEAALTLGEIGGRVPLTIRQVDIEDDDALLARYVFEIPVVLVAGAEIARAPIVAEALERALRQLARGGRPT